MINLRKLQLFVGSILVAVLSTACVTDGGPSVPDTTLFSNYQAIEPSGDIRLDATAPGFIAGGDYEPLTEQVLASYDATTRGFPAVMAQVRPILDDIVAAGPRPDLRPEIALRPAPGANAIARREDLIILTTGLFSAIMCDESLERDGGCVALNDSQRMDALAFVIAHEYAHTLLGHPTLFDRREQRLLIADDLTNMLAMATSVASVAQSLGMDVQDEYRDVAEGLGAALIASPVIEGELYRGAFGPYARSAEVDADFLATDMLARTGTYNPYDGAEYLRTLFSVYNNVVKQRLEAALEASSERVQLYAGSVTAAAPSALLSGEEESLLQSMRQMAITEGFTIAADLYDRFSQRDDVSLHYASDMRADLISQYGDRFAYPREMSVADLTAFGFTEAQVNRNLDNKAERGAALARAWEQESAPLLAAQRARELMANGDYDGARAELDNARGGQEVTEYLMARGQLALATNENFEASEYFLSATRQPDAQPSAYGGLAMGRYRRGQVDRALATLDQGEERFGDDALLIERLEILVAEDREAAIEAAQRCEAAYDGDRRKLSRCEALAPEPEVAEEDAAPEERRSRFGIPDVTGILPGGGGEP